MADSRNADDVFWVEPDFRGIIPFDRFHAPRSLRKVVRQQRFTVTVDTAFAEVIAACAASAPDRNNTWINPEIEAAYIGLHRAGHAHSVECWLNGELAGGLYGVRLAGAFFGESMFSRATDASKVALVHLVHRLNAGGFRLLDTQFLTDHLQRFGALKIPRENYKRLLAEALAVQADFYSLPNDGESSLAQSITQMS
tara:strand:- start:1216 stop:1806 length:591 start_codon:yes stop_codon:yes gene_type:complete